MLVLLTGLDRKGLGACLEASSGPVALVATFLEGNVAWLTLVA